jgi:hypothetical protein
MRARRLTGWLLVATAAGGCGSSTLGPGADGGPSGGHDGSTFCAVPLLDDCSASPLQIPGSYCPLEMGIQRACRPCGPLDAGQDCGLRGALVSGAKYTYIQILNVDVVFAFVYDKNGTLVAKLVWSANTGAVECTAGPPNFDPREAMSLVPVASGSDELAGMCP